MARDRAEYNAYMRAWNAKNKHADKKQKLKRFNLSLAEYQAMVEAQNNLCAICHQPEKQIDYRTDRPVALAVDHDHATGQVRGLLCVCCNRGLGMFQDSPELLEAAAEYLRTAGA